jgi:hypothetical protein
MMASLYLFLESVAGLKVESQRPALVIYRHSSVSTRLFSSCSCPVDGGAYLQLICFALVVLFVSLALPLMIPLEKFTD